MLTAPVLLSAIPESYNSVKLVFSSVYSVSDSGISFNVNAHDYNSLQQIINPTFSGFANANANIIGPRLSRIINKDSFSPAHIRWYQEDGKYTVVDTNFDILDINNALYGYHKLKSLYSISVVSSNAAGQVLDTGKSINVSADVLAVPLMYDKDYRTAVTDWVTVPLVGGRKRVYVATSGSDSNDGLSTSSAKLTVSSAYNILSSGDHILFRRGDAWTNQAFGGTSNGLPSNLCADNKSGSSLTAPTYVGAWGDESQPLPVFHITNSAITTFFLADNDDQYSGLKNFYVKCLHITASGKDFREEQNGHLYPTFFSLLNTGGSAVATGASGDALSENILIEGCTFQEIGTAIKMAAYYNSLERGNGTYNWGTANFVSSYTAPAAIKNVLIRRNIFKDLYYVPADSISRAGGYNAFLSSVLNFRNSFGSFEYRSTSEPDSLAKYNMRFAALVASINRGQPKAIFLQGTSGHANTVEGNIFYRCGNKSETYPDTFDRSILATVHAEGGYAGINVFRNIFYKSGGTAVKQLDGGSNISNIYYRNPESIVMMGDVGLYEKKTYQGVPTLESFSAVSSAADLRSEEGGFVPYWYWFNKNTGLSIVAKNIIEEPQDIGYNIKNVSGEDVFLNKLLPEQTAEPRSTAIRVAGGKVLVTQNYIGNISKGICTGKDAVILAGYGRNLGHLQLMTHPTASSYYEGQNKVIFTQNTINNHGSLTLVTHNFFGPFLTNGTPSTSNLFEPSCLIITNNTLRNRFWNKNAVINGAGTLTEDGVSLIKMYSDALYSPTSRIVFLNNKLGFNTSPTNQRGFQLIGRVGQPNGEYSYANVSSMIFSLFGTTLAERQQTVSSNVMFPPQDIQSIDGDTVIPWLDTYIPKSVSSDSGWPTYEPYNYGQASGTRIFYVDPINGSNSNNGLHPSTPFRNIRSALSLLEEGRPDWILLRRGRVFELDATESGYGYFGGTSRHINSVVGILLEKSGRDATYPMILGSYGAGADPTTGNWFGSDAEDRPILARRLNGPTGAFDEAPGFLYIRGFGRAANDTWFAKHINIQHIVLSGVDYETPSPANAFCRYSGQGYAAAIQVGAFDGAVRNLRLEGILVSNWHSDQLVAQVANLGTAYGVPNNSNFYNRDIVMYRCAMYLCYPWNSQAYEARVSTQYVADTSGISAIDCLFDSGGKRWNTPFATPGVIAPASANGQGSKFSHNLYWGEGCWKPMLVNCILARSSAHGFQMRTGGQVYRSVFIKNPIAGGLDLCDSGGYTSGCINTRFTRLNSRIIQNLVIGSDNIGGQNGQFISWGFNLGGGSGLIVDDNIIVKPLNDYNGGGPTQAFNIGYYSGSSLGFSASAIAPSSLTLTNNIVYNWLNPNKEGTGLAFNNIADAPNLVVSGNKFYATLANNRFFTMTIARGRNNAEAPIKSFSNNFGNFLMYFCNTSTGLGCLRPDGFGEPNLPGLSLTSVSAFTTFYWNDTKSIFSNVDDVPEPTRSVSSYVDMFSTEAVPTGMDKVDYFLTKARNNRKGNWSYLWTAESLNNYIREGFGKAPVGEFQGVENFMLSAINNLACNNSSINFKMFPQNIINANLNNLIQSNINAGALNTVGDLFAVPVQQNLNLINELNSTTLVMSDQDMTVSVRNTTSQPLLLSIIDATDQVTDISIAPKTTRSFKKNELTSAALDTIKKAQLPVLTEFFGVVSKSTGSVPPTTIVTVADVKNDNDDIRDLIKNIINTYGIPTDVETLIYAENKQNFFSDKQEAHTQKGSNVNYYLSIAYPIVAATFGATAESRRNALLVTADFMRYALSIARNESKLLLVAGGDKYLLDKFARRIALLESDIVNYCDAALTKGLRTVDSVYTELGISTAPILPVI